MNILYIANGTSLFGANRSMLELIDYLRTRGHNIYIFLPQKGPIISEIRKRNIKYKVLEYKRSIHKTNEFHKFHALRILLNNIILGISVRKYIKQWKIELIHTNSLTENFGALLSLIYHLPHIWHVREMLYKHYGVAFDCPCIQKLLMKRASKIIFISKTVANYYKYLGIKNSLVIYNGFNCDKYIINRNSHFSNDTLNVILCGVINKSKNQMDAIKSVKQLRQKNLPINLTIVGTCTDKKYFNILNNYIKENELSKTVQILPFHNDLKDLRKRADIELTCSKDEALGRVVIEGMLSELLVIGFDSGATTELIKNKKNGYLYSHIAGTTLSEMLQYVWNHKMESKEIIQNAKIWAKEKFAINNYGEKIELVYLETNTQRRLL